MPSNRTAPSRRPVTGAEIRSDAWLALGLLVTAILSTALGSIAGLYGDQSPDSMWALLYVVALTAPLALRRRFPEVVAITVAVVFFVGVSARIPELYVGNVALFISMYTVGAWVTDRRRATIVRVLIIVGMLVWLLIIMFQVATAPPEEGSLSRAGLFSPFAAYMLIQFLVNIAFFGGAYYMGDRAHAAAVAHTELQMRTAELEREREVSAAQAVALDRVRIARELHDVVAHHVSAMGVQAGAARTVLTRDPEAASTALRGVEEEARAALDELRLLLQTLRGPDEEEAASTVRLTDLRTLVEHARSAGLPVELSTVGQEYPLPSLVQVNLFRVTQEALTNVRRHAGPGASADVRVRYEPDSVELEVSSTGHRISGSWRPGLGVIGMRERAASVGGTIEIGPQPRGVFLVRMRVPYSGALMMGAPA